MLRCAGIDRGANVGSQAEQEAPVRVPEAPVSWWRIGFICSVLLLEGMSSSSINVQVGELERFFALPPALLHMVVSAFLIAYAGLLPLAGRWVDVGNRRTVFLLGVALFGLGCALCAAASSGIWLVVGRFVQGAGAALSAPAALALITADLPPGRTRNRALGLYGSMGALGFSLGLVLPAVVVTEFGWRVSFMVFLPLVALILVVGGTMRASAGTAGGSVDLPAAAALTASLMLAVHAVGDVGRSPAWWTATQLAGAAALALFVRGRGRQTGSPMFPRAVIRSARVLGASIALGGVFAAIVTSMYLASLALQVRHSFSAFEVGLALVPQSLSNAIATVFGARLVTRFGPRAVILSGMAVIVAALGYLGTVAFALPYAVGILPAIVAIGAGVALCYPAASIMAVDAVEGVHHGTVAGLLTAFQNVGGAVGLALATAAALVPLSGTDIAPEPGMVLSAAMIVIAGLLASGAWMYGARERATV